MHAVFCVLGNPVQFIKTFLALNHNVYMQLSTSALVFTSEHELCHRFPNAVSFFSPLQEHDLLPSLTFYRVFFPSLAISVSERDGRV